MFLYIITDHPDNAGSSGFYRTKLVLEEMAGDCCLMLRYNQLSRALITDLHPWAICHSGGSATYDSYDILQHADYRWVVTAWDGAQIGFCGGHQLLAAMHGSTLGHLRELRDDEPDLCPGYHAGLAKEWGVYPVRIVQQDPLFAELPAVIRMQEYHMDEVKALASELILLASTTDCRVQAYVHRDKPLYGTQFHPEEASAHYPHGFQLLRNFFAIARQYAGVEAVRGKQGL